MPSPRRPADSLLLLTAGLAGIAGAVAWLPLLSLLLPRRVEAVAGSASLGLFTLAILVGIVAASGSNILFGWWSDRRAARNGSRRGDIVRGLALSAVAYLFVAAADTPTALVIGVAAVQFGINALLAPLLALMAEVVPDARRGVLGALLAWSQPFASAIGALLIAAPLSGDGVRLLLVPLAMTALLVPLLMLNPARVVAAPPPEQVERGRRDLAVATVAQWLVQVAGAVLSLYLVFYLASVLDDPAARFGDVTGRAGTLMAAGHMIPLPVALLVGRWSDRVGRRSPFLAASAGVAGIGLAIMAAADGLAFAAIGYGVHAIGTVTFLALNAARAMRVLPDPRHRGRDLGLFNLANTTPLLIGAGLTWTLTTPRDFSALLLALALFALLGGAAALLVAEPTREAR